METVRLAFLRGAFSIERTVMGIMAFQDLVYIGF
jgi:hypothetical protein